MKEHIMNTIQKRVWLWLIGFIFINWGMVCHQTVFADSHVQHSFKTALLLPREVDADGWTRSGYAGLLLIEKQLQAEIAYSENLPESEFEQVFRKYAQDGFDFIIGHGGQFVSAAEVVAKEFLRTKFAITSKYAGNNSNLGALSLREGELGYLAGVVAAVKTKKQKIGYIGGVRYKSGEEVITLFERGVKHINPNITIFKDWNKSWTDQEGAVQLARKQIRAGVDILAVNAGKAGLAIHPLAEKAGIYTLGWIEDQQHLAPKAVITSLMQDISRLLLQGATLARKGLWEGKQYRFGLREGVQYLAPFRGMLSPDQKKQVQAVVDDIILRKIDLTP
ncbi:basic membrane protein A and related proteins [Candidatus Magnetomoraceae bacterium gMMP-15]